MEIEHGEGTKWQMKGILVFVFNSSEGSKTMFKYSKF